MRGRAQQRQKHELHTAEALHDMLRQLANGEWLSCPRRMIHVPNRVPEKSSTT
jgi:hypothetical protein